MKNLKVYSKCAFCFHKAVVKGKQRKPEDPGFKDRLDALAVDIAPRFDLYDQRFADNTLTSIAKRNLSQASKADLLELYAFKRKKIQELRFIVTTLGNGRILNTCQYCTINEVGSFDHFLPKDAFPDFVVHPKNLIPCCSVCNGFKGQTWTVNQPSQFINFYLDILPDAQFLFVDIELVGNVFSTKFFLENTGDIDDDFFKLLETHYEKLHLLRRFSENSGTVLTELECTVAGHKHHLNRNEIVEVVEDRNRGIKAALGFNYWQAILIDKLVNTDAFMDRLF